MSNRELDERVARALGVNRPKRPTDDPGWDIGFWAPPRYSSDWSCCEEMLAWLASQKRNVHMSHWSNKSEPFAEASLDGWQAVPEFAATLPEALARLVVAVAEAKEKKA